eukprot:1595964-Rhodomonas_salina.1
MRFSSCLCWPSWGRGGEEEEVVQPLQQQQRSLTLLLPSQHPPHLVLPAHDPLPLLLRPASALLVTHLACACGCERRGGPDRDRAAREEGSWARFRAHGLEQYMTRRRGRREKEEEG